MIFYVIRHKASGELMPQCKRSGYSNWNPDKGLVPNTSLGVPRLLDSRRKAARCIVQWNSMPNAHNRYYVGSFDDDGGYDIEVKPDGRKKEDLEIVEVELVFKS